MSPQPGDPASSSSADGPAETSEAARFLLEPGQLTADTTQPLPRARLSRRARAGLWLLRIFALVVSAMVVYTFVAALHG